MARPSISFTPTTPSLRNLAREHFYEEEAEMVPAVADRLGRPHDDLVAHVAAGVVASALWVAVDRWIAEGADLARLDPMIDAAFAVLTEGVEGAARRAGN